ncbi:hypothetical protein SAMN06296273_0450 [Nitrosomonas ureae]|uniref:Soluble cytochrome b562 n=1 Tax=Nitrosomonas ureae TaxID=44577 RepID=A0A285BVQ6_9PROT|nr:DUF6746 family protein [Nitrosomonas ureae]SNX58988.1 hypothetical protein SAMN06296273_0450 [Nitrosomonas ureae]
MKRPVFLTASILILGFSTFASASERPDHFKGKSANTLKEAVINFSEHNAKLEEILTKENLTPEELYNVHQLTYTLEKALKKINEEFVELAETLEKVHVASETADAETAKNQGLRYLETARQVIK